MTLWLRRSRCAICNGFVVFDDKKGSISCVADIDLTVEPCKEINVSPSPQALKQAFISLKHHSVFRDVLCQLNQLNQRLAHAQAAGISSNKNTSNSASAADTKTGAKREKPKN